MEYLKTTYPEILKDYDDFYRKSWLRLNGRKNGKNKQLIGYAQIDPQFHDECSKHSWCLEGHGYAMTKIRQPNGKRKGVYLHQFVWLLAYGTLPVKPLTIDHKDHTKKLDNRLLNLHAATQCWQKVNTGLRKDNTSKHKGISPDKSNNSWQVYVGPKKDHFHRYYKDYQTAVLVQHEVYRQKYGCEPISCCIDWQNCPGRLENQ